MDIALGVAVVFIAAQEASGAEAYLKSVGPPPLRFEFISTNNALFLSELALPKPKFVTPPPMPLAPTNSARSQTYLSTGGGLDMLGEGNGGLMSGAAAGNAGASPNSASDMLSVTPQMINEYFKPNREDNEEAGPLRHGDTIFVPAELGFVPPTPESRAIYQSK
jgi:hypothetical protein